MENVPELPSVDLLTSPNWTDYALIDSGGSRKLERFGAVTLIRPEAEAVWSPRVPEREWARADAEFVPSAEENGGHWVPFRDVSDRWTVRYGALRFCLSLSNSKQLGIFPEQACQWDWVQETIRERAKPTRVLNLFGYTGAMTMAAAAAGAQVTHLDASKKAIQWAKENQAACRVPEDRIRWILDDGLKFVQREARRGSFYQGQFGKAVDMTGCPVVVDGDDRIPLFLAQGTYYIVYALLHFGVGALYRIQFYAGGVTSRIYRRDGSASQPDAIVVLFSLEFHSI